jgi:hypothetical protein
MRAKLPLMVVSLRRALLVVMLSALATAAAAADFVVVRSSDPALLRGQAFDADRMAVLKFILARTPKETATRGTRARSGICPAAEAITTLDAVAQAHQGGCPDQAAQALDALLAPGLDAQR